MDYMTDEPIGISESDLTSTVVNQNTYHSIQKSPSIDETSGPLRSPFTHSACTLPLHLQQQANLIMENNFHFGEFLSGDFAGSNGTPWLDMPVNYNDLDLLINGQEPFEIQGVLQEPSSWDPAFLSSVEGASVANQIAVSSTSETGSANTLVGTFKTYRLPDTWPSAELDQTQSASHLADTQPSVNIPVDEPTMVDPNAAFSKYSSLISRVTPHTFSRFLVKCLRDYHQHIPLEGLFNLLYKEKHSISRSATLPPTKDSRYSESQLKGLLFCRRILKVFQDSQSSEGLQSDLIRNSSLRSINFHELLRTFLAIKILLACVKTVDSTCTGDKNLPRCSVYKVYCMICHKQVQNNKDLSKFVVQSIVLGQSKVGQLMNMIHPDLVSKRLGRRGESRFHYIGMQWNDAIVDADMKALLKLEIPELNHHFQNILETLKPEVRSAPVEKAVLELPPSLFSSSKHPSFVRAVSVWHKPLHSVVEISFTYPLSDCSPRVWKVTPNKPPSQPKWAKTQVQKCLDGLKSYDINLDPLIEMFNTGKFPGNMPDRFVTAVLRSIKILSKKGPSNGINDAYMHLILGVSLLVFPVIVSSDEEVSSASKEQLRRSLETCVRELEVLTSNNVGSTFLRTFMEILRKMTILLGMTSYKVPSSCAETILKEKYHKFSVAGTAKTGGFKARSPFEDLFFKSIMLSFKAVDFNIEDEFCESGGPGAHETISRLAKMLAKKLTSVKDCIMKLLVQAKRDGSKNFCQDISYQLFKTEIQLFHESLADPLIGRLPISVVNLMLHTTSQLLQSGNVEEFKICDFESSTDDFQCSWVIFSMFQEYLNIIAEIVSLSKMIKQSPL
ncbi:hypothetical protein JCM33374_g4410 [Metschnikowia sp. JCM 33374]|nr:hypothetical protein JCM33374_g4410 [Metschnikowia sp. JCM 33374]